LDGAISIYRISKGAHRVAAARLAGFTQIPAMVRHIAATGGAFAMFGVVEP
jgi:ParB-like chromosome segregation protein Spo0J